MEFRFGYSTLKTITITYNVLSALCGVALIAIGSSNMDEADDFEQIADESMPKIVLVCLILIGIFFLALRFVGLGGFCYEKKALIRAYGLTSFGLAILLALVGLVIMAQGDDLAKSGHSSIIEHFQVKRNDKSLHRFQDKYECCGDISPRYWPELPDSCCNNGRCDVLSTIMIGCALQIEIFVKSSAAVMTWTCFGVALVGLFGVFLSWCIWKHLNAMSLDEEDIEEDDRK